MQGEENGRGPGSDHHKPLSVIGQHVLTVKRSLSRGEVSLDTKVNIWVGSFSSLLADAKM